MAASFLRIPLPRVGRTNSWCRVPVHGVHTTAAHMQLSQQDFEKAQKDLKTLKKDPGNDTKLRLYALFKQEYKKTFYCTTDAITTYLLHWDYTLGLGWIRPTTVTLHIPVQLTEDCAARILFIQNCGLATQGSCNAPKPGMLDFVNKAKWDAWNALGNLSKDEARKSYVELVSNLISSEAPAKDAASMSSGQKYDTLQVVSEDNITKIFLNRPEKKNAITLQMYNEICLALDEAAKDDSVFTVLTGHGDYFCSGNDLNNFTNIPPEGKEKMASDSADILEAFVAKFIDFPKPLIAVVNGPAVGISVTILGLFDMVYATDRATFHTPFSQLGQSPEGCSSYTFPRIMGLSKAVEVLLFNKLLTANEACKLGLLTEVFPDSTFQKEVWERLKAYGQLPKNSLAFSKQLIRETDKKELHAANVQECERLKERWLSDECMNAIINFFQKKAKL